MNSGIARTLFLSSRCPLLCHPQGAHKALKNMGLSRLSTLSTPPLFGRNETGNGKRLLGLCARVRPPRVGEPPVQAGQAGQAAKNKGFRVDRKWPRWWTGQPRHVGIRWNRVRTPNLEFPIVEFWNSPLRAAFAPAQAPPPYRSTQ